MADVSPDIIERVVLGVTGAAATIIAFSGAWMFNHLKAENETLRSDLNKYKEKYEEDLDKQRVELITLFKESEERILSAIVDVKGDMTPKAHCDAKQTEWQLIFAHQQGNNSSEHKRLMTNQEKIELAQIDISASLAQIVTCLHDLKNHIPCKEDSK